jgi:hypothetical protein
MAKPKARDKKATEENAVTPKRRHAHSGAAKAVAAGRQRSPRAAARVTTAVPSSHPAPVETPAPAPPDNDNTPRTRPLLPLPAVDRVAVIAPAAKPPERPLWLELWQPIERRLARRKRALAVRRRKLMVTAYRKLRRGLAGARYILESERRALGLRLVHLARAIASAARKWPRHAAAQAGLLTVAIAGACGHWALRQFDQAWDAGERVVRPAVARLTSIERAAVAAAVTALAVAIVAIAWVVVYSQAPPMTQPKFATPEMAPPAPPKYFTERVAAPAVVTSESTAAPTADTPKQIVPAQETPQAGAHASLPATPKAKTRRRERAAARHHKHSRDRRDGVQ